MPNHIVDVDHPGPLFLYKERKGLRAVQTWTGDGPPDGDDGIPAADNSNALRQSQSAPIRAETDKSVPLLSVSTKPSRAESAVGTMSGLRAIFMSPFSLLLACVPLCVVSSQLKWGDTLTFTFSFLSLLPLAKILGDATEELAAAIHNDAVAGILNATFGNLIEMLITISSLRNQDMEYKARTTLVKSTLLGSILSNLLLVMGMAFFAGGLKKPSKVVATGDASADAREAQRYLATEKEQAFATKGTNVSFGMLIFCCMTFALPSIFAVTAPEDKYPRVLKVSQIGAGLVITSYIAFLVFQLFSHRHTLEKEEQDIAGDTEDEEEASLSIPVSLCLMVFVTIVTDKVSDKLCEALTGFTTAVGMPMGFLGVIVLPIAGNACEHLSAVRFAMVDKVGLAVGIAVGSATQVALFVVPFAVIVGVFLDVPMDLNFGSINTAVIFMSVLLVLTLMLDGRGHWLKGYIMMLAYVFIGTLYWFLPPGF